MQFRKTTVRKFFLSFLLVSFLGLGGGCASLPDVSEMIAMVPPTGRPPQVASAQRRLSPDENREVIDRLQQTVPPTDILTRHIAVMQSWTGKPLISGNKVTLLVDDANAYDAMYKAMDNARDHINLETFFIENDPVGNKFAQLLLKKQAQGVQVNLIYDSIGSFSASAAFFKQLQDGGINVVKFSPISPPKASQKWWHFRLDHRKVLVVDGTLAITGGVNVSQGYSINISQPEKGEQMLVPWRDTDVQIEGPVVAQLQTLFMRIWQQQKGPKLALRNYFPQLQKKGDALAQIIENSPGRYKRLTFVMYVSAFTFARHSIHLTMAYFVPDDQALTALTEAARRGVDVKIVLPSATDFSMTIDAARFHYSRLLKAGVKIYERQDALLHAKTAVIDGIWSTVGSTNMDYWSFLSNDEVNAVIIDRSFATQMEALFEKDIEQSDRIKLDQWEKRSSSRRFKEWFAHSFTYWL